MVESSEWDLNDDTAEPTPLSATTNSATAGTGPSSAQNTTGENAGAENARAGGNAWIEATVENARSENAGEGGGEERLRTTGAGADLSGNTVGSGVQPEPARAENAGKSSAGSEDWPLPEKPSRSTAEFDRSEYTWTDNKTKSISPRNEAKSETPRTRPEVSAPANAEDESGSGAYPRLKSFGQLKGKRGPAPATNRPAVPGPGSESPASGKGSQYFTVVGDGASRGSDSSAASRGAVSSVTPESAPPTMREAPQTAYSQPLQPGRSRPEIPGFAKPQQGDTTGSASSPLQSPMLETPPPIPPAGQPLPGLSQPWGTTSIAAGEASPDVHATSPEVRGASSEAILGSAGDASTTEKPSPKQGLIIDYSKPEEYAAENARAENASPSQLDSANPEVPEESAQNAEPALEAEKPDGSAFIGSGFSTVSTPIESPFTVAAPPAPRREAQAETLVDKNADNKHFREACLALSTADSAMGNENYKIALPLFEKAYRLFRKASASHLQEYATCVQKLGDCLFREQDNQAACDRYQEFLDLEHKRNAAPNALRVVILLKLAKTYQRLEEFDEAEATFDRAVSTVNQALAVSHPLFSVVYNTYIAFLESLGTQPDKLGRIEQELADKLMTASSTVAIPEELKAELSAWTEPEQIKRCEERQKQLRLSKQMFQKDQSEAQMMVGRFTHSGALKSVVSTIIILLLVGSFACACFFGLQLIDKGGTSGDTHIDNRLAQYVEKLYTSADKLKKMKLHHDGTVELNFGEQFLSLPVMPGPPKQGIMEDIKTLLGAKSDYVLNECKGGFSDAGGSVLYAPDVKDAKLLAGMDRIAELAGFYYSRNQMWYPKKRSEITELSPGISLENPFGGGRAPLIKAHEYEKDEGDKAFSECLAKYAQGKPFFEEDGKAGTPPGLIECLSLAPFDARGADDCVAFFIRAYDSNGRFVTSSTGDVYVVAYRNGVKYNTTKPEAIKPPFKDQAKTTVYLNLFK